VGSPGCTCPRLARLVVPLAAAIVGTNDNFGRLTAAVAPNGAASVSRSHVAPGRYRISVRARSGRHESRLAGHGLSRRTGRGFRGVATWNVTLVRGSYTYRSDVAHSNHRLRVG
jgi:hypothetical protein